MELAIAIGATIIAACALGLNIILAVRGGQWGMPDRLTAIRKERDDALKQHRKDVDDELREHRREVKEALDRTVDGFGETVRAMQKKIGEFELWARDMFVRRDSFIVVNKETRDLIERSATGIERQIDKLEKKVDAVLLAGLELKQDAARDTANRNK